MTAPNRFAPKPVVRPFSWSYSKLKNYETCPKRHFHADIKKDFKDELGDNLILGNMVHEALANAVAKGMPLPDRFAKYQHWVDRITSEGNAVILVEQKLAITENYEPCEFFANNAWFRGVVDVAKIIGPVALVADYKTGKIVEDSVQLALFAQLIFAHHPTVQKIRTEFIWLADNVTTREDFKRTDMPELWASVLPRLEPLIQAHKNGDYPAVPGYLCRKYCPVTICAHHGG